MLAKIAIQEWKRIMRKAVKIPAFRKRMIKKKESPSHSNQTKIKRNVGAVAAKTI